MSIEVKGIVKTFGAFRALDNVSLHVPSGSLLARAGSERSASFTSTTSPLTGE